MMMMTKSHKQYLLLLVVLAGCCSNLASAKNNILSQIGNIMTDNSNNQPTANYDAATGTVLAEDAKKDMSCDGQLASALVEAKELASNTQSNLDEESSKHKAALETIVDLQKNLAKTKANFVNEKEEKIELKATLDEAIQQEKTRSSEQLEAVTTKAREELEAVKEEKDSTIAALKEESSRALKSLQDTAHMEFQQLKNSKDEIIASLEDKLKMSSEELQETMRLELEKAKRDKETKVAEITADKQATVERMTQTTNKAKHEASERLQKTKEDAASKVAALQANIESLQEENEGMTATIASNEQFLDEANAEITQWRTLHAQRSYCNMTHVATDLYDASAFVYRQASDKAVEVYDQSLEYSSRAIQDKYEEHWPKIAPYYEDAFSSNYQRIEPHLENYVFPHVRKASAWTNDVVKPKVLEVIGDGKNAVAPVIEEKYQGAADLYANYCKSSLQEFHMAIQEVEVFRDHPPPSFLLESWESSCENPRDSIRALVHGVSMLLAIVFYRRILALAWAIVVFILKLPVRLTPLRFFLLRKNATKSIESPPSSPSPLMKEASSDSLMKAIVDDENEHEVTEGEADATLY